jgi:cytochrome c biogenesis protein CcdA
MKFKWMKAFVKKGQEVLLTVLLWNAYLAGLGLTVLFILIFNRKFLGEQAESNGSFWKEAKGYGRNDHDVMRQS